MAVPVVPDVVPLVDGCEVQLKLFSKFVIALARFDIATMTFAGRFSDWAFTTTPSSCWIAAWSCGAQDKLLFDGTNDDGGLLIWL